MCSSQQNTQKYAVVLQENYFKTVQLLALKERQVRFLCEQLAGLNKDARMQIFEPLESKWIIDPLEKKNSLSMITPCLNSEPFNSLQSSLNRSERTVSWQDMPQTKENFENANNYNQATRNSLSKQFKLPCQSKFENANKEKKKMDYKKINSLQNQASDFKAQIASLEAQSNYHLKTAEYLTKIVQDLETQMAKKCICDLEPNLEASSISGSKDGESSRKEAENTFKQKEVLEISHRIKDLEQQRDDIVLENMQLADKNRLLAMREKSLQVSVHTLSSKELTLTKSVQYYSGYQHDLRKTIQAQTAKHHNLRLELAELESKVARSRSLTNEIAGLTGLQKALMGGKLITMMELLSELLDELDEAVHAFLEGRTAYPAFLEGLKLVTYEKDNYARYLIETFGNMQEKAGSDSANTVSSGENDEMKALLAMHSLAEQKESFKCEAIHSTQDTDDCDAGYQDRSQKGPADAKPLGLSEIIAQKAAEIKRRESPELHDTLQDDICQTPFSKATSGKLTRGYHKDADKLMAQESINLYNKCKSLINNPSTSGPATSQSSSTGSPLTGLTLCSYDPDSIEGIFTHLLSQWSTAVQNVKLLLNHSRLYTHTLSERLAEQKALHTLELAQLRHAFAVREKAVRMKYQYLQRNCDYFRAESESVRRVVGEEIKNVKAERDLLRARYEDA